MTSFTPARAVQAALIHVAVADAATAARADIKDYEFRLVDKTVRKDEATVSVRLFRVGVKVVGNFCRQPSAFEKRAALPSIAKRNWQIAPSPGQHMFAEPDFQQFSGISVGCWSDTGRFLSAIEARRHGKSRLRRWHPNSPTSFL